MADQKPTTQYYSNLGGVNQKNSEYSLDNTQFLDLKNLDFDVPNALQKRVGSTQAVGANTSGPVIGLFEYKRLNGASWIVAGTDTALFYLASNAYTLLDTGWTNGQPQDFVTFVNKLFIANGQNFKTWDGGVSTGILLAGLPGAPTVLSSEVSSTNGASFWTVAGASAAAPAGGAGRITPAMFVTYSYVRSDGFYGPVDLRSTARNIVQWTPATSGSELFSGTDFAAAGMRIGGFTVPSGFGITAIAIWVATDIMNQGTSNNGLAQKTSGSAAQVADYTLTSTANLNYFKLFTLFPSASLFTIATGWGTTFIPAIQAYSLPNSVGSTLGTLNFFATYFPKYLDVNQNVMFMSGFSTVPSTIWFSDIGRPESIQPDYNFEVRTNDGDRIMGHKSYNGNTIVFKEESFHKVIGTTPEDFQLIELSTEFGCLSNNSIIEYNEKLLFLDRKGIIQYDGSGWRTISDSIDEVFRRMNLSAARENACAIHHNYRNQIWFGIPVDGSTKNNLTVVYDYLVNAWTFFDGFNVSAYSFIKGALSKPTVWRGSYSGMIYYHGESFFGDNGQGITCLAVTRFEQFNGENSTNVWRRLFLDVATAPSGATGLITGKVFTDYDRSTVKATFSMLQNVFQSKAEVGAVGKAVAAEFVHNSSSLPLLINGFSWSKRNLRNI